jgi:hypothetical protein
MISTSIAERLAFLRSLEWREGGWQFDDTKRPRSRRVVKLQAWVVSVLREHRAKGQERSGDDLVFRAKRGGPIRESYFVRRYFKPLLATAGLPGIRLYDLRHTAATISLAAGVSPKVISEQLGHASVAFTLDVYSHVLPHMQAEHLAISWPLHIWCFWSSWGRSGFGLIERTVVLLGFYDCNCGRYCRPRQILWCSLTRRASRRPGCISSLQGRERSAAQIARHCAAVQM